MPIPYRTCLLIVFMCHAVWVYASDSTEVNSQRLPWSVTAGVYGGPSVHTTDFISLPDFPNCCEPYTSGSGLMMGLQLGAELQTGIHVFDKAVKLNLSIGYQLHPASLTATEVVGNIISGNSVTDGTVEHQLDLAYSGVTFSPSLAIPLPAVDGLHLVVGGIGMFPLSATIDQQQLLANPTDNDYTFENGERIRDQHSGNLPGTTTPMVYGIVGLRYDMALNHEWTIAPTMRYVAGLTNITSAAPWSVAAFQAGVMVAYQLPKPKPPIPAVVEPPPTPKSKPLLQSTVSIVSRTPGSHMSADTIYAPVITENIADTVQAVMPVLYFEHNSTIPVNGDRALVDFVQAIQQSRADSSDQLEHITITASTSYNEDPRLARERISRLTNSISLDPNFVTVVLERAPQKKYPELDLEAQFVRVTLGTESRMLHRYTESKQTTAVSVALTALHTVTCEAGPCTTSVSVNGAMPPSLVTTDPVIPLTVPIPLTNGAPAQPSLVAVTLKTTDTTGTTTTSSSAVVVVPTVLQVHRKQVWVDPSGTSNRSAYLLALFDFDGTTPVVIDKSVVTMAQEALHKGKAVTLAPCTDAFGAAEHNVELRRQRAEAALRLLGSGASQVTVDVDQCMSDADKFPQERSLCRSVWVLLDN